MGCRVIDPYRVTQGWDDRCEVGYARLAGARRRVGVLRGNRATGQRLVAVIPEPTAADATGVTRTGFWIVEAAEFEPA